MRCGSFPRARLGPERARQLCEGCLRALIDSARARLRWSYGLLVLVALPGPIIGAVAVQRMQAGVIQSFDHLTPAEVFLIACAESTVAAYSVWAMYWGVPRAWRWWQGLFDRLGQSRVSEWIGQRVFQQTIPALLFFYVPLVFGAVYGLCGGALIEYLRCRRLATISLLTLEEIDSPTAR